MVSIVTWKVNRFNHFIKSSIGTGLMIHAKVSLPSSMLLFSSRELDGEIFCLLASLPFVFFDFLLPLSAFLTNRLVGFFRFVDPVV